MIKRKTRGSGLAKVKTERNKSIKTPIKLFAHCPPPRTAVSSWAAGCHEWSSWQTPARRLLPWSQSPRPCLLSWVEAAVSSWSWPPGEEPQDRQGLRPNPIRELFTIVQTNRVSCLSALAPSGGLVIKEVFPLKRKRKENLTFASSWLAKKGGLHMQKS